jgi:hypothetical protein
MSELRTALLALSLFGIASAARDSSITACRAPAFHAACATVSRASGTFEYGSASARRSCSTPCTSLLRDSSFDNWRKP